MKIGIITMISDNYGNRLQNYALQEVLKDLGVEVETFHNPFYKEYNETKHQIKKIIKKVIFLFSPNQKCKIAREERFEQFNRQYIMWSKFWLNNKRHWKKIESQYDFVICGSDQIWNPESYYIDGRYFGIFMPGNKRFSYAASFGIENIMEERKNEWKEYLKEFKAISVREDIGVTIVKELLHKTAYRHIDPTLLLAKEKWEKIGLAPCNIDISVPYLLTYFLGSESYSDIVQKYAKVHQLKVIALNEQQNRNTYIYGPLEFLFLIQHANIVMTDSFHGTIFSIVFQRQFIVFERKGLKNSMESRVNSLLFMLGLEKCKYRNEHKDCINLHVIDYQDVMKKLQYEQKKSILYLKNCLH